METLYDRIKAMCELKGMTMYAAAKRAGINPSRLSDLKAGRNKALSATYMQKLADVLGTTPSDLVYGADSVTVTIPGDAEDKWLAFARSLTKTEALKLMQALTTRLAE